MNLIVGTKLSVRCIDLDFNGYGVVRYDGAVIFVMGLLKGEEALIEIIKVTAKKTIAWVLETYKYSPDRVILEPLESALGAYSLLHLSPLKQLDFQKKITSETLRKIAGISFDLEEIIQSENTDNYRNKALFHVLDNDTLTLALYTSYPVRLVKINYFRLAVAKINQILLVLNESQIIVDSKLLKHLVIRVNEKNQALVTLVATKYSFKGLTEIINVLKCDQDIIGITLNIKGTKDILSSNSKVLYGKNELVFDLGSQKQFLSDQSFYQVNSFVALKVYKYIKELVLKDSVVIDGFSGIGSIGLFLAHKAQKVIMIDNNKANINDAQKAIEYNKINNVEIIHSNFHEALKRIAGDLLIVDPPRSGLDRETLKTIIDKEIFKIIYLSCDCKTLSRDLKVLQEKYQIKQIVPIRMFPLTVAIETLVELDLKE